MKIALECKPDERLVMGIGVPRKEILHQNDKGDVCNYLKKNNGNTGLVDEDPGSSQPAIIKQSELLSDAHGVKQLRDASGNNIIVLCPRLEDWIIDACNKSKINLKDFYLADRPKELAKEINYRHCPFKCVSVASKQLRKGFIICTALRRC